MVSIYKEILNQRTDKTQKFNNSLLDIIQFMELMQKEMPLIFQRWKASKKG